MNLEVLVLFGCRKFLEKGSPVSFQQAALTGSWGRDCLSLVGKIWVAHLPHVC